MTTPKQERKDANQVQTIHTGERPKKIWEKVFKQSRKDETGGIYLFPKWLPPPLAAYLVRFGIQSLEFRPDQDVWETYLRFFGGACVVYT